MNLSEIGQKSYFQALGDKMLTAPNKEVYPCVSDLVEKTGAKKKPGGKPPGFLESLTRNKLRVTNPFNTKCEAVKAISAIIESKLLNTPS